MRKYLKVTLCGLAALMLITGCSKKEETAAETTAAATAAEEGDAAEGTTAAPVDPGKLTKLGQYKGVEVERMSVDVTDEELDARIQTILASNPEYVEMDRAAKEGDTVDIDFVGMKDGEAFEGGTAEGYRLELGSHSFIDGFEEGIVGAKKGDELSLNLTFPENYQNTELAGQAVVFDVTVNAVEERKEAVLDDAFVKRMSDFATVDEFKADILATMQEEKETQADDQFETDAVYAAIQNCEFDVNQDAVDEQFNNQINYYNAIVQMYGMTLEDYVSVYGMTEEQFKEDVLKSCELAVKQQLLVDAVAEAENFQIEDADRENLAEQYGMDVQSMIDNYGEDAVDETAMVVKVVDFIKDNAVVK